MDELKIFEVVHDNTISNIVPQQNATFVFGEVSERAEAQNQAKWKNNEITPLDANNLNSMNSGIAEAVATVNNTLQALREFPEYITTLENAHENLTSYVGYDSNNKPESTDKTIVSRVTSLEDNLDIETRRAKNAESTLSGRTTILENAHENLDNAVRGEGNSSSVYSKIDNINKTLEGINGTVVNAIANTVKLEEVRAVSEENTMKTNISDVTGRVTALEDKVNGVTTVMDFAGTVDSIPTDNSTYQPGDVIVVTKGVDAGKEFVYDGTTWQEFGNATALSTLMTKVDTGDKTVSQYVTAAITVEQDRATTAEADLSSRASNLETTVNGNGDINGLVADLAALDSYVRDSDESLATKVGGLHNNHQLDGSHPLATDLTDGYLSAENFRKLSHLSGDALTYTNKITNTSSEDYTTVAFEYGEEEETKQIFSQKIHNKYYSIPLDDTGLYKVAVDETGHVSNYVPVSADDIALLGISKAGARNVVGNSVAATHNSSATNGNVFITHCENDVVTSSHNIVGENATSVYSDLNGHIHITSDNTKVTSEENHYIPASSATDTLTAVASSTIAATWDSTSFVTGLTIERDSKGHVTNVGVSSIKMPSNPNSDTKNTAGSTNTSSKIYLIGAKSQGANPQTYSHDTAYIGTDGCLYSGGNKVLTSIPKASSSTYGGIMINVSNGVCYITTT